jgi:hypothetical protein
MMAMQRAVISRGGEAAEENVIEHKNGVLANPVPGRVEVMGFERVENRLDTFDISVAVLTLLSSRA